MLRRVDGDETEGRVDNQGDEELLGDQREPSAIESALKGKIVRDWSTNGDPKALTLSDRTKAGRHQKR